MAATTIAAMKKITPAEIPGQLARARSEDVLAMSKLNAPPLPRRRLQAGGHDGAGLPLTSRCGPTWDGHGTLVERFDPIWIADPPARVRRVAGSVEPARVGDPALPCYPASCPRIQPRRAGLYGKRMRGLTGYLLGSFR